MSLEFDGFDWDEGNSGKNLKKHGLDGEAIERFLLRGPLFVEDPKHSRHEQRYLAVGKTETGRWMLVSFTFRTVDKKRLIRAISARYMHAKELSRYEDLY